MNDRRSATRLVSIDLLRAVAIVLMTLVHFVENLAGSYGVDGGPFIGANRYWWVPTGLAAPLFTFLAGLSYRLSADAHAARGLPSEEISKITVRRGLFLILLGLVFNVVVWMPEDVFNWDILTLIGTAMLALDAARRAPPAVVLVAIALLVGLAPALRGIADYDTFWSSGYYDYELTLGEVATGFLVTGYFPVFPWLALPLTGFLAAPYLYGPSASATGRGSRLPWIAGAGLLATAVAVIVAGPFLPVRPSSARTPWSMFPPTTAYVVGMVGGIILAAAALHHTLDRKDREDRCVLRMAGALSRHSLSIYLLHHVIHLWPLWIVGFIVNGEPTSLWQVAMPVWMAIALAAVFLPLATYVARRMDRPGAPSAEACLRWLCEP
jgi:uncharacterized membrane protein